MKYQDLVYKLGDILDELKGCPYPMAEIIPGHQVINDLNKVVNDLDFENDPDNFQPGRVDA